MVDAPPVNVTFSCPDYLISHEEGSCTLSVLSGTNLQVQRTINGVVAGNGPFYMAGNNSFILIFVLAGNNILTSVDPSSEISASHVKFWKFHLLCCW